MRKRPTMADVAKRLRVSKMTISRVINGRDGVSAATRARVLKLVESLGYVPSQRGRSLAVGKSNLIGMVVLNVTSEWVWPLMLGAGHAVEGTGYQLLLRTTGPGAIASLDTAKPVFGGDLIDGAVIVSWLVPLTFARKLASHNVPAVLIDAYERPRDVGWVSAQDRNGASAAVAHLAQLGHRRLAFIGGGETAHLAKERLGGFLDGLAASALSAGDAQVVHGDFSRESGYDLARKLLRTRRRPTAILAANDEMAVGALDAASRLGMVVPDTLSIVGFDDVPIAAHVSPALTTVARPYREMGATAVRMLIEVLAAKPEERRLRQVDLPVELVIRGSTAPPGGQGARAPARPQEGR